jgi:hypothetical protein
LVLPIIAYTLFSIKLEIRENSFCLVARGQEGRGREWGEVRKGKGGRGEK